MLASFVLCSCTAPEVSRDDIDKIYGEIDALKTQVSQINTNISSMQTVLNALQGQDYVTAVTPISRDGVELGFTINFQKSGAVTIYHGRDGKDGKDGRDGQDGQSGTGVTPVIGVRQHTDGAWYWTLNGEWLKDDDGSMVRANGRDGQDGKDGEPGQPGTPGEDGAPGNPGSDGSDGVTPQLKIDNSYWYISYDEGSTWKMVGPATGEAGASGDAMFQNVNTGNADYVLFTLIDGTQIKIPTWTAFSALKEQCGRMNSDVVTLQSIVGEIQKGGYITSVNTVYDGLDETGYLLSFNDGRTITVHHGKNGRDGRDAESTGTGGSTVTVPAIGARQHTNGQWYWTLDGEWLKDDKGNMVCASGQKGEDGQPGTPGADGEDGQPGAAGRDGITPELKIESDYWYVSYDNGTNWKKLGKATGEPGAAGESGTSIFKSVDAVSSDQYVSLFLADNTEIKLQRYAGISIVLSEQDDIEILHGETKTISYEIKGTIETPKVSVASVDGWHASIHKTDNVKGTISVTAPNPYVDGSVTVLVSEGAQTVMEILSFMKSANTPAEAVDLGLSVMWASWNVGATKPEEYGDYFAWGETETHYELGYAQSETPVWKSGYSDGYDWTSYTWCNGPAKTITKYGTVDNKTVLELSDDVAHVKWGGNWRMPTEQEWDELIYNCTRIWTTQNGVEGYKVTSKKSGYTSKSIFLPAAGRRVGDQLELVGTICNFWSSSLDTDHPDYAYRLVFNSYQVVANYDSRRSGRSVRPVCGNMPFVVNVTSVTLDKTSESIKEGETLTLTATVSPSNATDKSVIWSSSNTSVAIVDQNGKVTAVNAGSATITVMTNDGSKTATCAVTVTDSSSTTVAEAVDLGLSVKWASFNVGATKPEEYGGYYQWGGTDDVSDKSIYIDWNNCPYHAGSSSSSGWTKYIGSLFLWSGLGEPDNKITLEQSDDVAHVQWGDKWRMPTNQEWQELIDNCTWTWTTLNGVVGYLVTSTKSGYTDKWIYLPAAGDRFDDYIYNFGYRGYYWSSSLSTLNSLYAYYLYFDSNCVYTDDLGRYRGRSVRPVSE